MEDISEQLKNCAHINVRNHMLKLEYPWGRRPTLQYKQLHWGSLLKIKMILT